MKAWVEVARCERGRQRRVGHLLQLVQRDTCGGEGAQQLRAVGVCQAEQHRAEVGALHSAVAHLLQQVRQVAIHAQQLADLQHIAENIGAALVLLGEPLELAVALGVADAHGGLVREGAQKLKGVVVEGARLAGEQQQHAVHAGLVEDRRGKRRVTILGLERRALGGRQIVGQLGLAVGQGTKGGRGSGQQRVAEQLRAGQLGEADRLDHKVGLVLRGRDAIQRAAVDLRGVLAAKGGERHAAVGAGAIGAQSDQALGGACYFQRLLQHIRQDLLLVERDRKLAGDALKRAQLLDAGAQACVGLLVAGGVGERLGRLAGHNAQQARVILAEGAGACGRELERAE